MVSLCLTSQGLELTMLKGSLRLSRGLKGRDDYGYVEAQTAVLPVTWGDSWCNGLHVCFPSLPPMLLCEFGSRLGLESSGCSTWHLLNLVARAFFPGTPVSSPPSSVNGSADKYSILFYSRLCPSTAGSSPPSFSVLCSFSIYIKIDSFLF